MPTFPIYNPKFGRATNFCELLLLRGGFGQYLTELPHLPLIGLNLAISTTPFADDGTGGTEFSGDTYAAVPIAGWYPASVGTTGSPGITVASTTPASDTIFDTPTVQWWPNNTTYYPYITDLDGNVLWWWIFATMPAVNASNILVIHPTDLQIAMTNQGTFYLTGGLPDPVAYGKGLPYLPDEFYIRALDGITGAASHDPVTQWYLGATSDTPGVSGTEPPQYVYIDSTTGAVGGEASVSATESYIRADVDLIFSSLTGSDPAEPMGTADNAAETLIHVPMSDFDPTSLPGFTVGWGENLAVILADGLVPGAETYSVLFFGTNAAVEQGDDLRLEPGDIEITCR